VLQQATFPSEQKLIKIFEKRERGRIKGLPNFLGVPAIISGTGKATNFKFGQYIYRVHIQTKAHKNFGEKERGPAWAHPWTPGTVQLFPVSPIISGTGKATNFNFCMHIYGLKWNKSPLKFWEK